MRDSPTPAIEVNPPASISATRSAAAPRRQQASAMGQALALMRRMVLEGSLSPGEQIRQQEMAELLGVSRVPLREALNVLADQGLLVHRPHSGYFVSRRSADEVRQIRRMLELLETELLASMAWPDEALTARLHRLNDEMRRVAQAQDWIALMQLNREFHFGIFGLSPDRLVLEEVQRLWSLAEPLIAVKLGNPLAAQLTLTEHDAILAAIARRDRDATQARLAEHRDSSNPLPSLPRS